MSLHKDWLGQIPDNWETKKISALYRIRNEKVSDCDYEPLSVSMKGVVPQLESTAKTDDHDNRKLVRKGDFAINSRSDRRNACGISDRDGSVSLINLVMEPRDLMNPGYYNWLFHTPQFADEFYKWGHGIVDDLWTTNWADMKNISLPYPPLTEQDKISRYLDKRCKSIDASIQAGEKLIEKLKEYKQATITKAVTRGLIPNSEMKDSNVEWIGVYPANWTLTKFKYLFEERNLRSEMGKEMQLSVSVYKGVIPTAEVEQNLMKPESLAGYKLVFPGDLVFNKLNPTMARFGCSKYAGLTSPDFSVYYSKPNCADMRYMAYLLKTKSFVVRIGQLTAGVGDGFKRLYTSQLYSMWVAVPSIDEQIKISDYLDKKCGDIDKLVELKKKMVDKLVDYKKAIIYSYVTGKKEIPNG